METVREEEEIEQEKLGVREWIEENDNKIDNMVNSYYELCKGTALFPPQNCIMMLWSNLSLFKYY